MQPQPTFCPECGAPAPFRGTTISLVCEYCSSTVVRTGVDVALIGKVSAIVDNGSPIVLGARGRFEGVPFEVLGRLQVRYERGTWNEWYIEFADSTMGWLTDAMGQYSILRLHDPKQATGTVPHYHDLGAGLILILDGVELLVTDKRAASYQGAEGMLPFAAQPGLTFYGADLRGFSGAFASLDYGTDPAHDRPVRYFGRAVELDELGLHPLRSFEGWRRPSPPAMP